MILGRWWQAGAGTGAYETAQNVGGSGMYCCAVLVVARVEWDFWIILDQYVSSFSRAYVLSIFEFDAN
jgi:hypothetical protein